VIAYDLGTPPLEEVAEMAGGTLRLPKGLRRQDGVRGASIDSRTIEPGELFVPLPGSHVDGHEYLATAFERGAGAALCARDRYAALEGHEPGPLIVVDDVTRALQDFARGWRGHWTGILLGVTGSAGKTTTKNLTALAFGTRWPTHRTAGNLNNHWGVPLTLLGLRGEHRAAVVEMGMNQPGEIAMLAALAHPTAGLITNVGTAHLERFGTVEAIAREKASLADALPADAPLFVGADSPALLEALKTVSCRIITFGLSEAADVRPMWVEDLGPRGSRFEVPGFPPVALPLVGRHQVRNALAALAVAREWNLDRVAVVQALESVAPEEGRMQTRTVRDATLIVDCYNANPDTTRLALQTLASWPEARRRIAVLGDMLELGAAAPQLHRETGAAVRDAELWVVGVHAADYETGATASGIPVRRFATKPDLARALLPELGPGTVVLFKASRGAALEDVVDQIEREA
jgi:UDP-N-acetylmuramoyl-tripeptide--D-alanyl-D-alanine ligase